MTRGDTAARVDRVSRNDYLGRVVAWVGTDGVSREIGPDERRQGLRVSRLHRFAVFWARIVAVPVRATYRGPSVIRSSMQFLLRCFCRLLLGLERVSFRWGRRLSVLRAALLTTEEKDRLRRKLYASWSVQEFTALQENVEAGLTLIEEVALTRHDLWGGQVLVVGCGPGREALVLAERGASVVGIDWQESMLDRARQEAKGRGLEIEFLAAEADSFTLGRRFDRVVIFSGLINMLLPRQRRVAMLSRARAHLEEGGRVVVTFLSAYVPRGGEDAAEKPSLLGSWNEDHESGDLFLINEAVHIYPRARSFVQEAAEAGLEVQHLYRDQRAYDRSSSQVRGYAVLVARS